MHYFLLFFYYFNFCFRHKGIDNNYFSDCNLQAIPPQIADWKDIVVLGNNKVELTPLQPHALQLFLGRNMISELPPQLFLLRNLTVLTLRQNHLTTMSSAIRHLVSLRELNVSGNYLTTLPGAMLELENLSLLVASPNPLLQSENMPPPTPPPSQPLKLTLNVTTASGSMKDIGRSMVSRTLHFNPRWTEGPARLTEQCLVQIIKQYKYTELLTMYDLPPDLAAQLYNADERREADAVCANCKRLTCEVAGYAIEFWNGVGGSGVVPFKQEFCSGLCMKNHCNI